MVSAMRPTMRSVQPPKKPAATPARPPIDEHQRDREDRDDEIEPRRHDDAAEDVAAELIGAEPVRGRRRLQRGRGVARQRIVRRRCSGPKIAQSDDQHEQAEGEAGDRVVADARSGRG